MLVRRGDVRVGPASHFVQPASSDLPNVSCGGARPSCPARISVPSGPRVRSPHTLDGGRGARAARILTTQTPLRPSIFPHRDARSVIDKLRVFFSPFCRPAPLPTFSSPALVLAAFLAGQVFYLFSSTPSFSLRRCPTADLDSSGASVRGQPGLLRA